MQNNSEALSKEQQQAHRYALTIVDMEEAVEYLRCCNELNSLQVDENTSRWYYACRGLLSAAIVAYCRPFLDNRSTGFASQRVPISQLQAVHLRRSLHDLLIEKRNTFIAHADWSARSAKIAAAGPDSMDVAYSEPDVFWGIDINEFLLLASGIRIECIGKAMSFAQSGLTPFSIRQT